MDNYTVRVTYRNKDMEPVDIREYPFKQYCHILRANCLKCLEHIENQFAQYEGTTNKRDWDKENLAEYESVRKALLNIGNAIDRMPDSFYINGNNINSVPVSSVLARLIDRE